jgi:hypothetical protein
LEPRELLTLIDGRVLGDEAGLAVAPAGNILDDTPTGLTGDDFLVAAPLADPVVAGATRSNAGEVYVVFGRPGLDSTTNLSFNTLLNNGEALLIVGERSEDRAGFSVAGVGDVIGDSRPDILIGAPFAESIDDSATDNRGRAYLIGGEFIFNVLQARTTGQPAVIDLANLSDTQVWRIYQGGIPGDQAGQSVTGMAAGTSGQEFIAIGAPFAERLGDPTDDDRGAVYVVGPGERDAGLPRVSIVSDLVVAGRANSMSGPSSGAHLGAAVAGLSEPALSSTINSFSANGDSVPDLLVGAPDALRDGSDTERPGRLYFVPGDQLTDTASREDFDLSVNERVVALGAIPVEGAGSGDMLGFAVSGAGDLDVDGFTDFMFSAPLRDFSITRQDAGEVYVVFARNFEPAGTTCQRFCQKQDADGTVIPLNVTDFVQRTTALGVTIQGANAFDQAGRSLNEGFNIQDVTARVTIEVATDILIGAPFADVPNPLGSPFFDAGRAYVLFGNRDYQNAAGSALSLATLDEAVFNTSGRVFNGRASGDNYGIAVAAAGQVAAPAGTTGFDFLVGARGVTMATGQVELSFGFGGGPIATPIPTGGTGLPFIQPGPVGPQLFVGGFVSFTNQTPPAGAAAPFPLQAGVIAPFIAPTAFGSEIFLPDAPFALVTPSGSLNVFDPVAGVSTGVNLTAALNAPALRPGVATLHATDGSISDIFGVDLAGHLIHHQLFGSTWNAFDVTTASRGPALAAGLTAQRIAAGSGTQLLVTGRTAAGQVVRYTGTSTSNWQAETIGGPAVVATPLSIARARGGRAPLDLIYGVSSNGHLIQFRDGARGWRASDVTARFGGPALQGELAGGLFRGGREVFARDSDNRLVRYSTTGGGGWAIEDITGQTGGVQPHRVHGPLTLASDASGNRYVLAQAGRGRIVEFASTPFGWTWRALPQPAGNLRVSAPLAATAHANGTRAVYAIDQNGTLVEFTFNGRWQANTPSDTATPTTPSSDATNALDLLIELGILSR